MVDGLPRAVPLGQIRPWAAGPDPMQHPVDHPAVIGPPPPLPNINRQQQRQPGPLLVGQLMPPQPLVILHAHSQTKNRTVIYRTHPNVQAALESPASTRQPAPARRRGGRDVASPAAP